ncbi:MAG: phage tail tape measure C-terminal domain-containing protein [bacterium]
MAAVAGQVIVDLKAETAQFHAEMRQVTGQFSSSLGRMRNEASRFRAYLTSAFAAIGGARLFRSLIEQNRDLESMKGSLRTVTGSVEAAAAAMQRLMDFAGKTPFSLEQSIQAFIKLKALGLDPSTRAMESYGNTASAMGKSMTQMIEAVADASTGEMERLKEFGIKAKQEGDKVQFTFRGVTTEVARNADAIQEYLIRIGETDFAGAMDRQMEGLPGRLSYLEDSFSRLAFAIGEGGFTQAVADAADQLAKFNEEMINSGKAATTGFLLGGVLRNFTQSLQMSVSGLVAAGIGLDEFFRRMAHINYEVVYGLPPGTLDAAHMKELIGQASRSQTITIPPVMGDAVDKAIEDPRDWKGLDKVLKDLEKETQARNRYLAGLAERLTFEFDPKAKYAAQVKEFDELLSRGMISGEVHARALAAAFEDLRRATMEIMMATREWVNGAIVGLAEYADAAKDAAKNFHEAFTNAFRGLEDTLTEFFMTAKMDFKTFIDSIRADITRIFVRQQITGPLASWLGQSVLGGPSELFSFGGFRATGGAVEAGTAYMVGERGKELFVPEMPGRIIPDVPGMRMLAAQGDHNVNDRSSNFVVEHVEVNVGDANQAGTWRRAGIQVAEEMLLSLRAAHGVV